MVAAEFGMLEAALNYWGTVLLQADLPKMTGGASAARHASILADLVPMRCKEHPEVRDHLVTHLSSVEQLQGRRNDLQHAFWSNISVVTGYHEPLKMEPNWAAVRKSAGKNLKQFSVGATDMHTLADEIAKVRHEINRGFRALPPPVGQGAIGDQTKARPLSSTA
jgi:hypothetical protein